jgi:hypothetical protein
VASFGDLGYEVNLAAADPFSLSSWIEPSESQSLNGQFLALSNYEVI